MWNTTGVLKNKDPRSSSKSVQGFREELINSPLLSTKKLRQGWTNLMSRGEYTYPWSSILVFKCYVSFPYSCSVLVLYLLLPLEMGGQGEPGLTRVSNHKNHIRIILNSNQLHLSAINYDMCGKSERTNSFNRSNNLRWNCRCITNYLNEYSMLNT